MSSIMSSVLAVQHVNPEIAQIKLDLAPLVAAEARISELAIANPMKGPELVACFLNAYSTTNTYLLDLERAKVAAKTALGHRQSTLLLDESAMLLRHKGLSSARSPNGSQDMREALFNVDPECTRCRETLEHTSAAIAFLNNKLKTFAMAYSAAKGGSRPSGGGDFGGGDYHHSA